MHEQCIPALSLGEGGGELGTRLKRGHMFICSRLGWLFTWYVSPLPLLSYSPPSPLPFTPASISVPLLVVASGIDEKTLKCEGVCAASLPTCTTMAVVTHPGKLSFCPSSPLPFSCGIPSIVLSFLLLFFLPLPFYLLPLPTSSFPPSPFLLPPSLSPPFFLPLPTSFLSTLVDETSPVDEPSTSEQVTEGVKFAYTLPHQQSDQEDRQDDAALVCVHLWLVCSYIHVSSCDSII